MEFIFSAHSIKIVKKNYLLFEDGIDMSMS